MAENESDHSDEQGIGDEYVGVDRADNVDTTTVNPSFNAAGASSGVPGVNVSSAANRYFSRDDRLEIHQEVQPPKARRYVEKRFDRLPVTSWSPSFRQKSRSRC